MHNLKLSDDTLVRPNLYKVPCNLREKMDHQLNLLKEQSLVPSNSQYSKSVIWLKRQIGNYQYSISVIWLKRQIGGYRQT